MSLYPRVCARVSVPAACTVPVVCTVPVCARSCESGTEITGEESERLAGPVHTPMRGLSRIGRRLG